MSSSNAAAIRRRTGVNTAVSPIPTNSSTIKQPVVDEPPKKLTLQEVISVFDTRITSLEQLSNSSTGGKSSNTLSNIAENGEITEVLDEFNHRFEVIANEISELKETLLKLQTYTMDVNRMLLGERVQVLSELGTNINLSGTDDVDINSVYSLTSDANPTILNEPSSPTSVDMRKEVNTE